MYQQVNCPRCNAPIAVDIQQVIDTARNPEVKYAFLNGQLNMFACQTCGLTGQMTTPLLFHDPEHEMLMVYVPLELQLAHTEQQRLIGQMVKEVMDNTPAEKRRAYMLQPQTILSYQTFVEKVLETEGITPEMIAHQRKQVELLQTLARADKDVVAILLEERADEIDETFFALMQNALQAAQERNDDKQVLGLTNLQAKLYTETEVGRRLERQQMALRKFQQDVRRQEGLTPQLLLTHILANQEEEDTVEAIATAGQAALTYEFFALLTEEIEKVARTHDKAQVKRLNGIRQALLDFQRAIQAESQEMLNRANETLQAILQAEDRPAAVQEHLPAIDEPFMYLLSEMLDQAEKQGQQARYQVLREVYDLIVREAERQVPPQIRLINDLMRAETDAEQRQILSDNAEMVTPELAEMLTMLAQEMSADRPEMVERVRALQAMVAMRVA
ncbi:MAG: hypothetical protein KDH89_20400 [Anaerolineae bacterium]|nr:hypothetical protein [Anaerolineae bacterium]